MRVTILTVLFLLAAPAWAGCEETITANNGVKLTLCGGPNSIDWTAKWVAPDATTLTIGAYLDLDDTVNAIHDASLGWDDAVMNAAVFPSSAWTYYCDTTMMAETMCMCSHSLEECQACVQGWGQNQAENYTSAELAAIGGAMSGDVCHTRFIEGRIPRVAQCNDMIHNDTDGIRDYRVYPMGGWGDPGCVTFHDDNEEDDAANPNIFQCNDPDCDDEDGDGFSNFQGCGVPDPDCSSPTDNVEARVGY